jgi:hypothetical protein
MSGWPGTRDADCVRWRISHHPKCDKVERRSVASLVPYARNARTLSDEQVAQIAAAQTRATSSRPLQRATEHNLDLAFNSLEGQITKLKLVKRQMYGRAKIDLLKARLIGAA